MECKKLLQISILAFFAIQYYYGVAQVSDSLWDKSIDASQQKVLSWLSITAGGNAYRGDLNTQMRFWQPTLQVGLQLNSKRQWNGFFQFAIGSIRAEDPLYQYPLPENPPATPSTYFQTSFFSLHYELHYNLVKTRNIIFYLSQGIGFLRFSIKDLEGKDLQLQNNTRRPNENYSNNALMLPTGLGACYIFFNGVAVQAQALFYNPRTDFLDNISAWGTLPGNDNILSLRLGCLIPIYKQPLKIAWKRGLHTH